MYERKTRDQYQLWTDYKDGLGFEKELELESRDQAYTVLAQYNELEPQYTHKIVKRRAK